ncbi:MAG: class I SAM-dependent methyltransferase [Planctomycetota bacterium]
MIRLIKMGLARLMPLQLFGKMFVGYCCLRSRWGCRREALCFLFGMEDEITALVNEHAIAREGGVHPKHRLTGYHDFFTGRISAAERVLDAGCGNGAVAFDVARKTGARVVGVDIDPGHIAEARRRFSHPGVEYRVGDVTVFPGKELFDVVVLSNILEHIEFRTRFLRELTAGTGAKRFLIRVPCEDRDWRVPLRKELGLEWRSDRGHFIEYTEAGFREEAAAAGLAVRHLEVRWGEIWAELIPAVGSQRVSESASLGAEAGNV